MNNAKRIFCMHHSLPKRDTPTHLHTHTHTHSIFCPIMDVCAAVAKEDMGKLKMMCEWACEPGVRGGKLKMMCEWAQPGVHGSCRARVAIALCKVLNKAQSPAMYSVKRQMMRKDVDLITTITPFFSRLACALPPRSLLLATFNSVTSVVRIGVETDCDRGPLSTLAQWCLCNESSLFLSWQADVVREVLKRPLIHPCSPMRNVFRRPDGTVCDDAHPSRPALMWWKCQLKKVVFLLEEDYIIDTDCQVLCPKLARLTNDLGLSTHSTYSKATEDISDLLRRASVAASCKWSLLQGVWIGVVVRSGKKV